MLDYFVRLTEQCPPTTYCVPVSFLYDVSSTSMYLANQPSSHPCYSCIDRFCDLCQAKKPQFLWHCLDCGTSPGFDMCEACFNTAKSEPIRELASPMVACEVPLIHSTVTDLSLLFVGFYCWWCSITAAPCHCPLTTPAHYH